MPGSAEHAIDRRRQQASKNDHLHCAIAPHAAAPGAHCQAGGGLQIAGFRVRDRGTPIAEREKSVSSLPIAEKPGMAPYHDLMRHMVPALVALRNLSRVPHPVAIEYLAAMTSAQAGLESPDEKIVVGIAARQLARPSSQLQPSLHLVRAWPRSRLTFHEIFRRHNRL